MTVPPDVATGGLTELAVRVRVDAGQVNTVPPGAILAAIVALTLWRRRGRLR
jgi:hypothetical protein